MKTLEQVKAEIKQLGTVDLFFTRREVSYLPEIMKENEHVLYLSSGITNWTTWLIVCTEERVILLDKGMFFGMKHMEIPLNKINSIVYHTGIFFGTIEIFHGSSVMLIEYCTKSTVKPFADVVSAAIKKFGKETATPTQIQTIVNNTQTVDVASQLERLSNLVEKGILSKEEFETQKKKLLGE